MPKRRRERDRPKAGPDAQYNPNKRILLSYESDDDATTLNDTTDRDPSARTAAPDLAQYEIDEYPDDSDDSERGTADVNIKSHDSDVSHLARIGSKEPAVDALRSQETSEISCSGGLRRNRATNQVPSLGLTSFQWEDEDAEEDYDHSTEEAIAYLKAVRSERQSIPAILTASHTPSILRENKPRPETGDYGDDSDDEDQAFIGTLAAGPPIEEECTPQVVFTHALKDRFFKHRKQLQQPTTVEALQALGPESPISFPNESSNAYAEWQQILSSRTPQSAQVRSLEQRTIFDLLALIQKHLLVQCMNVETCTSIWIWSLLASLKDVGNMTNDEVYPLRELGKKAVFLQLSLFSPKTAAQLVSLGQVEQVECTPDLHDAVGATHSSSSDALPTLPTDQVSTSNSPREFQVTDNTKATLDMIIVVVGVVFGQRDLLEFRHTWPGTAR